MIAVITIRGAERSGALAQLTLFFSQKRYALKGHQMAQSESGEKLLLFKVDATPIDKEQLAAEISGVSPEYVLVDVAYEEAADAANR